MRHRIPSNRDIAQLTRDEWESLCAEIASHVFQTQRVEDRLGRGNGLDGWRRTSSGIEGFQYRRLDDRFGDKQAFEIKKNISLAVTRCEEEMKSPLVRYFVLLNIDLQPGHCGAKGEIEQWEELIDWAKNSHDVTLEPAHGVTWVLARLKQFPFLRPDLFEDIASAVEEARNQINSANKKLDEMGDSNQRLFNEFAKLVDKANFDARLKTILAKLSEEARIHFERGRAHGAEEEFIAAVEKLMDADRLLSIDAVDDRLRGHVLLILCAVKAIVGRLGEALADGEKAISILSTVNDAELLRWSRGNVAVVMYQLQRYKEASVAFEQLLLEYENQGNLIEIVRTLTHLTELWGNARDAKVASLWAERLGVAAGALEEAQGGFNEVTVAALGAKANTLLAISFSQDDTQARKNRLIAIEILSSVEEMAQEIESFFTMLTARAQRAQALWHIDELNTASELYRQIATDADAHDFERMSAHSHFNRGMILAEQKKIKEAITELQNAKSRYQKLGDTPSVADTDALLRKLAKAG